MYILIDLGGTNVRVGATESLEDLSGMEVEFFSLTHNFEKDFDALAVAIRKFSGQQKISAIGLAVPGRLDEAKTLLEKATNIPEWVGVPIKEKLSVQFGCPVFIDNDAVSAARGEMKYGDIAPDFMLVVWGTGIGGAVVSHGEAEKIDRKFLAPIEAQCGGHALRARFGKTTHELTDEEWGPIVADFTAGIKKVAAELGQTRIICAGGIAFKLRLRLVGLGLEVTDRENFGLYGAAALISYYGISGAHHADLR